MTRESVETMANILYCCCGMLANDLVVSFGVSKKKAAQGSKDIVCNFLQSIDLEIEGEKELIKAAEAITKGENTSA